MPEKISSKRRACVSLAQTITLSNPFDILSRRFSANNWKFLWNTACGTTPLSKDLSGVKYGLCANSTTLCRDKVSV